MNDYDLHPKPAYALFLSNFQARQQIQLPLIPPQILFRMKFEKLTRRLNFYVADFLMVNYLATIFNDLFRPKRHFKVFFRCIQENSLVLVNYLQSLQEANRHNNFHLPIFYLNYQILAVIFYDHLNSLRNYLWFMNFISVSS